MQLTDEQYKFKGDLEGEIWKPVIGYEGLYEVSNLGRVKSLDKIVNSHNQFGPCVTHYPERIMSRGLNDRKDIKHAYYQTGIYKDGKSSSVLIHRLVAQAFIPNPGNLPEVNHKDRNKLNNSVDNLEWCTKVENMQDAIRNGWNPKLNRLGHKNSEYWREKCIGAKMKPCRCLETGEEFESIVSAERHYNLREGSISNVIDKHKTIKGKYTFERIT